MMRNNENAGFDLYVPEDVVFAAGEKKLVSMKVKARMMKDSQCICNSQVHYWMLPRSSMSKTGLMLCNSVGVIDSSYRGELMAYLWNTKDVPVSVLKGDRLVQIVAPDMGHIYKVDVVDVLNTTERGEGGFGSTGC
jgi:dUTP pyrophosphatase